MQFGRTRDGVTWFVEFDYVVDLDKRRSLTGYVFTIGGYAISWKATLQSIVALLTSKEHWKAVPWIMRCDGPRRCTRRDLKAEPEPGDAVLTIFF